MQSIMGHRVSKNTFEQKAGVPGIWVVIAFILLAVAAVLMIPANVNAATQTISKVDIADRSDCAQIKVITTAPLVLHRSQVDGYLVFDLFGNLENNQSKTVSIGDGGIKEIKCGWYKSTPPIARIAVGVNGARKILVTNEKNCRKTVITIYKTGAKVQTDALAAPKIAAKTVTVNSIPAPESTISNPIADIKPVQLTSAIPVQAVRVQSINVEPTAALTPPKMLVASATPMVIGDASLALAQHAVMAGGANVVSLDFASTDIHDVLKALAVQSGVNIVASPDVKGNVTVSLNNMTVKEALKLITNLSGYKFEETSGSFVVGTDDNLKSLAAASGGGSTDQVCGVEMIRYSDPLMLQKLIQDQYPRVKTSAASASKESGLKNVGSIALSGCEADVKGARSLVQQIESGMVITAQNEVTELCEIKNMDVVEVIASLNTAVPGVKVSVGPTQGFQLSAPPAVALGNDQNANPAAGGPVEKKPIAKYILLQGARSDVELAKKLIKDLDIQLPQLTIEAKVVDLNTDNLKDLGIEWGGELGVVSTVTLSENRAGQVRAEKIGRFLRDPLNFAGNVHAINALDNGKVLASPNVLAIDGKPATVFIGDEVKYVTSIQATPSGNTVTTDTARVGVQLNTISTVSSDGYITMNLHPEVSVISGWKTIKEIGLSLPQISRRFVDSTVRIKDGDTIIIGGLIKDDDIKNAAGVPFLKNLPIFGYLFRYDHTEKKHSEVVMFITPKIMHGK